MNYEGRSLELPRLQGSWSGSYRCNNCNSSSVRRGLSGVEPPCWMIISTSSLTALQSSVDLRLLNGLLPVHSAFFPLFQFAIFHLLISVCTQFHHLFFGRPLSRLPWGLLLNTSLTLLLLSILLTWPIQFNRRTLTNESTSKFPNSCMNSLLYRFLQF